MRIILLAGLVAASGSLLVAQDGGDIPKDSELVSLQGCADDRTFIVAPRSEEQPGTLEIEPGRRFRLSGPRKLLDEIKVRERTKVEVTGLVRKSDIAPPQGLALFGGRVRIGGARVPQDPIADPRRDPAYTQAVIDVRSWRPLTGDCPAT
jgi:hypothetical protein